MKRVSLYIIVLLYTINLIYGQSSIYENDFNIERNNTKLINITQSPCAYTLEVRASLDKNEERNGESLQSWGIVWNYSSPENYYYAKIQNYNSNFGDFLDQRYATITIGKLKCNIDSIIYTKRLNKGVDMSTGENTFLMEWKDNKSKIFIGSNELNLITSTDAIGANNGKCGIITNELLHVSSLSIETKPDVAKRLKTDWTKDLLDKHFSSSKDELEGYWVYLDRNNNDKKAKIGGRYKIALIKDKNTYNIIYISGACTNSDKWSSYMLKGILCPTIFKNHFDLIWYDSMFEIIEKDAHADVDGNAILNLQFPLYETSFRLSKIPLK